MLLNNIKYKISKGFSLTELMVVITILAILASFALQYYASSAEEARHAKALQDLEGIKNAIKMYYVQTGGQYPSSIDALVGHYLQQLPYDPWGTPYKLDSKNMEVYCISKKSGKKISIKYGRKN